MKNSNLFNKNFTQENVKCHAQHEDEQVNFKWHYFPLKEIVERSNRDAFWENEGKIHEKGCVKEFFRKLAGWHLATSLQINFFTDNFEGF